MGVTGQAVDRTRDEARAGPQTRAMTKRLTRRGLLGGAAAAGAAGTLGNSAALARGRAAKPTPRADVIVVGDASGNDPGRWLTISIGDDTTSAGADGHTVEI